MPRPVTEDTQNTNPTSAGMAMAQGNVQTVLNPDLLQTFAPARE